ncbi:MAG TPA: hypothetical protein VIG97_05825 [Luteimonas sp.]
MSRRPGGVLSPYRLVGIGAPMAVWAVHLVVIYSLQGLACAEGSGPARLAGLEALTWYALAIGVGAYGLLAWLALRALRGWRAARADRSAPALAARQRFGAAVTGALCVLSAVAILFTTIPVLLLPGCA